LGRPDAERLAPVLTNSSYPEQAEGAPCFRERGDFVPYVDRWSV
jgi:hypothetical protein